MFAFRPMLEDDLLDVVRWRSQPHVEAWFPHPVPSLEVATERFSHRIAGDDPVRMWVTELGGVPIGYVQSFPVSSDADLAVRSRDPAAIGFDYLIGESDLIGKGLGTDMIECFCREVLLTEYPDAPRFLAAPDVRNRASIRALEKCGFTQGLWIEPEGFDHVEVVCTVDRSHFEVTRK